MNYFFIISIVLLIIVVNNSEGSVGVNEIANRLDKYISTFFNFNSSGKNFDSFENSSQELDDSSFDLEDDDYHNVTVPKVSTDDESLIHFESDSIFSSNETFSTSTRQPKSFFEDSQDRALLIGDQITFNNDSFPENSNQTFEFKEFSPFNQSRSSTVSLKVNEYEMLSESRNDNKSWFEVLNNTENPMPSNEKLNSFTLKPVNSTSFTNSSTSSKAIDVTLFLLFIVNFCQFYLKL